MYLGITTQTALKLLWSQLTSIFMNHACDPDWILDVLRHCSVLSACRVLLLTGNQRGSRLPIQLNVLHSLHVVYSVTTAHFFEYLVLPALRSLIVQAPWAGYHCQIFLDLITSAVIRSSCFLRISLSNLIPTMMSLFGSFNLYRLLST